jgi:murein DD-endopeptidase MepM/ murein hydrolase activator NlpD
MSYFGQQRVSSHRAMGMPSAARSRRTFLRTAVLAGALHVLPTPRAARATSNEVEANFLQYHARLQALLAERQIAEEQLAISVAAERGALGQFAGIEGTLRRLVTTQFDLTQHLPILGTQIAEMETRLGVFDHALGQDVDTWQALFGGAAEEWATDTVDLRTALAGERQQLETRLAAARRSQAATVDRLGQANTEIAAWSREADATARRVGSARERAFQASAQLAKLQESGEKLAGEAYALWEAIHGSSGVSAVSPSLLAAAETELSAPAPETGGDQTKEPPTGPSLVVWPEGPPPRYVPPRGPMAGPLIAAGPLAIDAARLRAMSDLDEAALTWALPVAGPITTAYGASTPYSSTHWGIDIGARLYTPVVAAAPGRVEYAGLATTSVPGATYGMVVLLRHGKHLRSLYAHLDAQAYGPAVRPGDEVESGTVIGFIGLTGYSTGPHLHFEARLDNRPFDPRLLTG